MSQSFRLYRQDARVATRQLLAHKGEATVRYFISKINSAKTEAQVCMVMTEVRHAI